MSYEANTDLEAAPASAAPSSLFGRLVDGLNAAGSVVIGLVMLLMCADVLLRNLINHPLDGVAELVATSIVVIVFLQLPATLRHGRMSRADLFIYATWPLLARAWDDIEFFGVEGVFTFPTWPMRAVVLLGAVLAALQYVLLTVQDWRESNHD